MRICDARMLVSRRISARLQVFMTSSSRSGERRCSGAACHARTSAATVPEPRGGIAPPMETRSFMRVVSETRHPSPRWPSISLAGMRTSVK
ncbi:MAG: hypothetical protein R2705_21420 [Ilumatobacteraceae bacterium]